MKMRDEHKGGIRMGNFKDEVQNNSSLTKKDKEIAHIFAANFNVNYGVSLNEANTNVTVFILEPEDYIKEGFGIEKEVALIISYFDNMEDRTLRAAEKVLEKYPFKNRVDTLCYFLVSTDSNVSNWLNSYYDISANSRIVIPFNIEELKQNKNNSWFVRDRLRQYSFDKDLFGYTLPLQNDSSFFGRQQILARYIDSIRRGQNRGIFGLRKTGKTSLLFKIMRTVAEQKIGQVFFHDCKNPQIRKKRWYELIYDINMSIANRLGLKGFECEKDELNCISSFRYLMKKSSERGTKIILIFDEIEYISYFAQQDPHWHSDYFDFWQTLWSEQSTYANLCFIICGVNAYVTEKDSINGIQNPLFGIIQTEYLRGLTADETASMIKTLGKRMGLKFDYEAVNTLYSQYGGHPMLTRATCSWLNRYFSEGKRPITINKHDVEKFQEEIDTDPAFYSYFGHIVSEIKQFYPDEYEMLEILSSGQIDDFMELSKSGEFIQHLSSYGLITEKDKIPTISLPVAGRYIAVELAKKEGRRVAYKLVAKKERKTWVSHRMTILIENMRNFENNIRIKNKPMLYGINSFPEAEKLHSLPEVIDENSFSSAINILYRCLVESIDNYGKSQNKAQYFSSVISAEYPIIYRTLDKVKEYRNERDHIFLTEYHKQKLDEYLSEDLQPFETKEEQLFCIQQKLIIELITSIYSETMNLD